jgi:hypothetical protein
MGDASTLRTIAVVLGWLTVLGGLTMAVIWLAAGGGKAFGPEDQLMAESGARVPRRDRSTSFSTAQLGIHGFLGLMTAALITYGATVDDDARDGYLFIVVAIMITAVPGTLMFRKWKRGERPALTEKTVRPDAGRAEDRLPRVVVYGHGLVALATALVVVLVVFVA